MVFSQVFVMAPIRSQDAELVFDVTQAKHSLGSPSPTLGTGGDGKGKGGGSSSGGGGGGGGGSGSNRSASTRRAGTCRVSLRELADQREHDLPLTVLKKVGDLRNRSNYSNSGRSSYMG